MRRLLAAGILYLIGISIVLTIKPSSMFTEEGVWKEFGIGRNPNTHTWMPFWLFAVLWALVCYILTTVLLSLFYPEPTQEIKGPVRRRTPVIDDVIDIDAEDLEPVVSKSRRRKAASVDMADGYYILNREATEAAGGVPKYVYLGKALPE